MNTSNKVDKTNSDIHRGLRKKSQEIQSTFVLILTFVGIITV